MIGVGAAFDFHAGIKRQAPRWMQKRGYWVCGVDIQPPEFEASPADEFQLLDLRQFENCRTATRGGFDEVYHLAADMGGIGYISVCVYPRTGRRASAEG